jgi:hypothetical protein
VQCVGQIPQSVERVPKRASSVISPSKKAVTSNEPIRCIFARMLQSIMGEKQEEKRQEEPSLKLRDKFLTKQIRGQRIIMARKTSSSSRESFTYGQFEDVYPMPFNFILSVGGYPGAPEQLPPENFEWIRNSRDSLRYEVLKRDLDGNYRENQTSSV